MKHLITWLLIYSASVTAQPELQWTLIAGGTGIDKACLTIPSPDGGYMMTGITGSNDGIISENKGSHDIMVVKICGEGEIDWVKTYGGSEAEFVYNIIQDENNGYIIVGGTRSSDGDILDHIGKEDVWIFKIDLDGNIIWQTILGGPQDDRVRELLKTQDNGYIIGGSSGNGSAPSTLDSWVVKLDEFRSIEWEIKFGYPHLDNIDDIIQSTNGDYITSAFFDTDTVSILQEFDNMISRIDPDGNIIMQKSYGGTGWERAWEILEASDGGFITVGQTRSDDGDISFNHGGNDIWIVKFDESFNIVWEKTYGGSKEDYAFHAETMPNGNIIICGQSNSEDGDVSINLGGSDIWVFQINQEGELIWEKTYGSEAHDIAYGVSIINDSELLISGTTEPNFLESRSEIWVSKLGEGSMIPCISNSTSESEKVNLKISQFDNTIFLSSDNDMLDAQFRTFDLSGRLVSQGNIYSNEQNIDLDRAIQGIYILELIKGKRRYQIKFFKK